MTKSDLLWVEQALNALFYAKAAERSAEALEQQTPQTSARFGIELDLPLWRVQWAVLPGFQVTMLKCNNNIIPVVAVQ
jgi:hypothetical protein